jgi:hypothetical protein
LGLGVASCRGSELELLLLLLPWQCSAGVAVQPPQVGRALLVPVALGVGWLPPQVLACGQVLVGKSPCYPTGTACLPAAAPIRCCSAITALD